MAKISVVIPTYNRKDFLKEAVVSVLSQTLQDWELIVIDDGSTDGTESLICEFVDSRITYCKQRNSGISNARNTGIKIAKGDYIAFLDSDDYFLPGKLETQVSFLDCNPEIGMVYGKYQIIDANGEKNGVGPQHFSETFSELYAHSSPAPSTVAIRKSVIEDVGLFNPEIATCEDFEYWLRVAQKHKIHFINEIVACYRIHIQNISTDQVRLYTGTLAVLEAIGPQFHLGVSKRQYLKRISRLHYMIAREKWSEKHFSEACAHCKDAILKYPSVGLLVPKGEQSLMNQFLYFIKPYLFYLRSFLMSWRRA